MQIPANRVAEVFGMDREAFEHLRSTETFPDFLASWTGLTPAMVGEWVDPGLQVFQELPVAEKPSSPAQTPAEALQSPFEPDECLDLGGGI